MNTMPTIAVDPPSLAQRTRALLSSRITVADLIAAASPKFGCLMAMLPSLETVIPNWAAENIKADTLAADGIETETHCTVLYGWHLDFNGMELRRVLANHPPLALTVGKLSRFECPDYDVIKFAVECPALVKLNRDLSRVFKASITPSEHKFNPHITAAYVQKGTNQELTASKIEGHKAVVSQLLYSLPEKKGRLVFDLGRASVTATLATRVTNLLRAADTALPAPHPHEAPRAAVAARYQTAVDDLTAHAKAIVLSKAKKKREQIKALFLLLMLDAADDAYQTIYPALAKLTPPVTGTTATSIKPGDLRAEAEAFARDRQQYLENFPSTVFDRLDAARQQAEADGKSDKEVRAELNRTASEIKSGQGATMSETEAQATYGSAQIRILERTGFETALWDQIDRPTKRETHADNMALGPMPIGHLYPNGQRYPGDPAGGVQECANCLCVLTGVKRK